MLHARVRVRVETFLAAAHTVPGLCALLRLDLIMRTPDAWKTIVDVVPVLGEESRPARLAHGALGLRAVLQKMGTWRAAVA